MHAFASLHGLKQRSGGVKGLAVQTRSDGDHGLAEDLRSATLAPTRSTPDLKARRGVRSALVVSLRAWRRLLDPAEATRVRAWLGWLAATASVGRPFHIYIPCYPELTYEPHSSRSLTTRSGLPAALRSASMWQNRQ